MATGENCTFFKEQISRLSEPRRRERHAALDGVFIKLAATSLPNPRHLCWKFRSVVVLMDFSEDATLQRKALAREVGEPDISSDEWASLLIRYLEEGRLCVRCVVKTGRLLTKCRRCGSK